MAATSLDPTSANSVLKAMRTEANLDEAAKNTRKLFVLEYVKDFSASKAVLRMGFEGRSFAKKGSEYLREPYVQQLIGDFLDNAKEDAICTRARVMAGLLTEATNAPDAGVRVSAWANLGKIKGMYIEKREVTVNGSGVMLLPATGSAADWEQSCAAAQAELKAKVTTPGA